MCVSPISPSDRQCLSHFAPTLYAANLFQTLQGTAEVIAAKTDWEPLYDSAALSKNQVPVASATYFEVKLLHYNHVAAFSNACA